MLERTCCKCKLEIVQEGYCVTFYEGKKFCECKKEDYKQPTENQLKILRGRA